MSIESKPWFLQLSCSDVRGGPQRRVSAEELMLLNCGAGGDSESPLDCKEIKQSILKEIHLDSSLERLMLKLELQYFGHLMQRTDSLGKTLMMGKFDGGRRRGQQGMR